MGKRILNDTQRASVRELHNKKHVSVTGLATIFGVSRGTIRFVLNPELERENRERTKLRQRANRMKENTDGSSN